MTTTESQITAGKAESIDTAEFGLLLAKVELAATKIDHAQRDAPEYEAAFQRLIAHIEAVREKDREEAAEHQYAQGYKDCFDLIVQEKAKERKQIRWSYIERAEKAEAERNHFKAIAERQAAGLAGLTRYEYKTWLGDYHDENSLSVVYEHEEMTGEQFVKVADVQLLLSPAQQEPAAVTPEMMDRVELIRAVTIESAKSLDRLREKYGIAAGATDAGQSTAKPVILEQLRDLASQHKMALVPLHITRAMQEVMDDEGWAWEDLLGAAEAITEDEYAEIAQGLGGLQSRIDQLETLLAATPAQATLEGGQDALMALEELASEAQDNGNSANWIESKASVIRAALAASQQAAVPARGEQLDDLAVSCGAASMASPFTHPNGPRTAVKFKVGDGSLERFASALYRVTPPHNTGIEEG